MDPIEQSLRAYEREQVEAERRAERIKELAELRFHMLKSSYGDWMEALREVTWMESERHLKMHRAACADLDCTVGALVSLLVDDELMRQAKEWADEEVDK